MKKVKLFLAIALSSVLTSFLALFLYAQIYNNPRPSASENSSLSYNPNDSQAVRFASNTNSVNNINFDFSRAAELTVNNVVHVKSTSEKMRSSSPFDDPFFHFFWGGQNNRKRSPEKVSGYGSGVIITKDGYIVTNNHVIEDATEIEITLNNKKTYIAEIVGTDPSTDIALIKIDADNLNSMTFGNSDFVKVGEWVLAVGNPFNLRSTVTSGIVSAKARDVNLLGRNGLEAFIQTDAAVNPGNSGGALVNLNGDLIGINTAISTRTGYFDGYSFAVPSNIVKKVVEDLLEYGMVQRAFLGVQISDLDKDIVERLDIDVSEFEGVYISRVMEDGGAIDAGLEDGDIITKVDNIKIRKMSELRGFLGSKSPGDKVNVTVLRDGDEKTFEVELRNEEGNTKFVKPNEVFKIMDATFKPLDSKDKRSYGLNYGVKIVDIGSDSDLYEAGIRKGMIILEIERKKIDDVKELKRLIKRYRGRPVLIEILDTYGNVEYLGFKIPSSK